MNLAEFVEETLSEILSGIRAAQKKEGGEPWEREASTFRSRAHYYLFRASR
jgi:hypothetical protein